MLALILIPFVAFAAERPPTWDMTQTELEEVGLGQSRGDPVPMPDALSAAPKHSRAMPGTIFVNFDGETIMPGGENSQMNLSMLWGGMFEAYGEGPKRDAVMESVRADWEPYDIFITDTRPAEGNYTMNMTGPTNFIGPGVLGVAPLDCFDAMNPNNITFAFHSVDDMFSAPITATTIGQEVAHSFGLEHVDEPGDIMNPVNAGGDPVFNDTCIPIVTGGAPVFCEAQHMEFCPDGTQQNAHQELLEIFGSRIPDVEGPQVTITYPEDGDFFAPGEAFMIEVTAVDDVAVESVQLYNNGMALELDTDEPYGWPVNSIPVGEYVLHVVAIDTSDNESTSNTVVIRVTSEPPPAETESGTDGDTDTDTDGAGATGDKGCGCATTPAPAALLLLPLLALLRRRRGD